MIAGLNTKVFRPHTVTVGMRHQHVASRTNSTLSSQAAKLVTFILVVALFVVFTVSQFMQWNITSSTSQLKQLQSVRNSAGSENIGLLAQRAQLTSEEYVVEKAGSKFELFLPGKQQVHKL